MTEKNFIQSRKQSLEGIAKIFEQEGFTLCEINDTLSGIGWQQSIEYNPNEAKILAEEDPERFRRIGLRTTIKRMDVSEEKYREICIKNAIYLYEQYPIAFEFYDELINGLREPETVKQKSKTKRNS